MYCWSTVLGIVSPLTVREKLPNTDLVYAHSRNVSQLSSNSSYSSYSSTVIFLIIKHLWNYNNSYCFNTKIIPHCISYWHWNATLKIIHLQCKSNDYRETDWQVLTRDNIAVASCAQASLHDCAAAFGWLKLIIRANYKDMHFTVSN